MKSPDRLCFLCVAILLSCLSPQARAMQPVAPAQDPMSYKIVSDTDLTTAFQTKSRWRVVVTQEPDYDDTPGISMPGMLHLCFIHENNPRCPHVNGYNILDGMRIIPSNATLKLPLLVLTADAFSGGSGQPRLTAIWEYRSNIDRFEKIFENETGQNHNEETRILTTGPLSGTVIVDLPTVCAPWPYQVIAFRLLKSGHYVNVLNYLGKTNVNDGDPRPVIDSEMPEIERRLLVGTAAGRSAETKKTHERCKEYVERRAFNSVR